MCIMSFYKQEGLTVLCVYGMLLLERTLEPSKDTG